MPIALFILKDGKTMNRTTLQRLVVTAIFLSLATVLSMIKVYELPMGGSITLLSMLPVAMISISYGTRWGIITAFIYSVIQLLLGVQDILSWGLTPTVLVASFFLDYILAYTSIGISGIFRKAGFKGICAGIFLGLTLRFAFHLISGTVLFAEWTPEEFASPLLYSVVYNGSYMLPEIIITCIGASILFKAPVVTKMMAGEFRTA